MNRKLSLSPEFAKIDKLTWQWLNIDRENGNKFRIEVSGQRIQIWVDGERIADVTDQQMGETIGGQTLDHGGVGFYWGMDSMGWIRNLSLKPL